MTAPPPTPAEKAEVAAIRRRWINLGELVAIAGLAIAAVTLWISLSDRRAAETDRARAGADQALVTFSSTRTQRGAMLTLSDPDHRVQQIDVAFPPSLGVEPQRGVIDPHINARWFEVALLKATDGGPDDRSGKLPVLITTTWWEGADRKVDSAIYQVAWSTSGRMFQGRALDLDGASLAERGGNATRLDVLWNAEKPAE